LQIQANMKHGIFNLSLLLILFSSVKLEALTCNSALSLQETTVFELEALTSWRKFESELPSFPVVNRESTHQDVLNTIEDFRDFADQVRQRSLAFDEVSKDLLFKFTEELYAEMDRFSIWYNEFRGSRELYKTTRGIVGTASRVRSYYFEAKVGFLLVRSGFQNIRGSTTLAELRQEHANEDNLSLEQKRYLSDRSQTEIDFTASRNGVHYLIELKSYLPIMNNRFFSNMSKTKTQMSKRAEFLRLLGLESTWQMALIFEYEIEPSVMREHFDDLVDIHMGLTRFTD